MISNRDMLICMYFKSILVGDVTLGAYQVTAGCNERVVILAAPWR